MKSTFNPGQVHVVLDFLLSNIPIKVHRIVVYIFNNLDCWSLPYLWFVLQVLVSLVRETEACLESQDAAGMRCGFAFFLSCIKNFAGDDTFYKEFLLPHLLPLAFLAPARPNFPLGDAQFALTLDEAASCIYALNSARVNKLALKFICYVYVKISSNHLFLNCKVFGFDVWVF